MYRIKDFIRQRYYKIAYFFVIVLVFSVSSWPIIFTAFLCSMATMINFIFVTYTSLLMAGIKFSKWTTTESGSFAWVNSQQPTLLIFIISCIGPTFFGWEYSYASFAKLDWSWLLWQILIIGIVTDIGFYTVHYIVHKVKLFRVGHNRHHKCDLDTMHGLCTLDENPFEAYMRDYVPTVLASFLFASFHVYTYNIFYLLYTLWAFWIHTGYNKYHLKHHELYNCNYGVFYITDIVMRTYK